MQKKDEKMAKKTIEKRILYSLILVFIIAVSFTGGYFSHYVFEPKQVNNTLDIIKIIEKFGYILDENGNVKEFTESDYAFALVNGLLDEYSYYYTKEEYDQKQKTKEGDTSGYGFIAYTSENQKPIIAKVMGNSSADRAGLKMGDLIISVIKNGQENAVSNGKELSNIIKNDALDDSITLTIERKGQVLAEKFTITKSYYKKCYIEYYDSERKMLHWTSENNKLIYSERPDEKLGYLDQNTALIRLSNFEANVAEQLQSALEYMKSQNRTNLILDLRYNGGGYMDVLEEVAGSLIYNGGKRTLIAHAKNKTSTEEYYAKNQKNNSFIKGISVLANESTASASECLIGAMLYYKEKFDISRLVIEKNKDGVAKTYGKGIMQTTYLMLDGGAFKLTTAVMYQPDKTTTIHGKGFVVSGDNATVAGDSAIFRALETLS